MLSFLWLVIIILSLSYGLFHNVLEINSVILNISYDSLDVFFSIATSLILWGGILEIAKRTNFLHLCTKHINGVTKRFFKTKNEEARSLISANFMCNFFGLSNLSAPFCIEAINCLKKEDNNTDIQSVLVMNYVGLSLFPMQMFALRNSYNASVVLELTFYILIIGLLNMVIGISLVRVFKCFT